MGLGQFCAGETTHLDIGRKFEGFKTNHLNVECRQHLIGQSPENDLRSTRAIETRVMCVCVRERDRDREREREKKSDREMEENIELGKKGRRIERERGGV